MDLGMQEIVLILFVALLIYGGRLPQVAMKVGRTLGELKRGLRQTTDMVRREVEFEEEPRRTRRAPRGTDDGSADQDVIPEPHLATEELATEEIAGVGAMTELPTVDGEGDPARA